MRNFFFLALVWLCLGFRADAASVTAMAMATDSIVMVDTDTASVQRKSFEPTFKSRYKDKDFDYTDKPIEKTLWERFTEWIANILQRLFRTGSATATGVEIAFKILGVIVVTVVIFLIVKAILNKEGQWIFGRGTGKNLMRYDEIEKNLGSVDFEKLIAETLQSGNNRLAVRYYYLWLLKRLSQREVIIWDIEKTNSDYLYEIKDETRREDFAYLSYLYNHIWYGEFQPDTQAFTKANRAFEKTIRSL